MRSRFRRTFYPGKTADNKSAPGSRLAAFACTAAPIASDGGDWSGCYGFCVDSTGTICMAPAGTEPKVIDGRCDLSTCKKLEWRPAQTSAKTPDEYGGAGQPPGLVTSSSVPASAVTEYN